MPDEVLLLGRDEQGQGLRATAREGEADQSAAVVTLRGVAQVVATPPTGQPGGPVRFQGETLSVDTRERIVSSKLPVTLTQDGNVVRGQSMRHDERTGVTVLAEMGVLFRKGEALQALPDGRTPTAQDWDRLSALWREDLDERINKLMLLRDKLNGCIGCGCLSMEACPLRNQDDKLGECGPGAQLLEPTPKS